MKEWSSPWNPFNSAKVLLWREHLEACAKEEYLPPVTIDIDPSNKCMYDCPHCFPAGTLVLTDKFRYVKIEELSVGTSILGFEQSKETKRNKLVSTKVKKLFSRNSEYLYKIQTENGEIYATPEQKIWEARGRWKRAENFKKGDEIRSIEYSDLTGFDGDYARGWLYGMALGDGCFWDAVDKRHSNPKKRRQFRLAVADKEVIKRFKGYAKMFGFNLYDSNYTPNKPDEFSHPLNPKHIYSIHLTANTIVKEFEEMISIKSENISYVNGFLGGVFDADGSFSNKILRICQLKEPNRNIIKEFLDVSDFDFKKEKKGFIILGGLSAHIKFLNSCMPVLKRKNGGLIGGSVKAKGVVTSVEKIEFNDTVYDIETGTHDFIANGFRVHNCNAYDMITNSGKNMSEFHMIKLIDFLADWRDSTRHKVPNSACVSGGGEPYMNKNLNTLFERMYHHKMEIGIITTGALMNNEDIDIVAKTARWIGFSMDAGTNHTYKIVKGIPSANMFEKVQETISILVKRIREINSNCDVAYKFLLTPDNATEIYQAIKIAKSLGVKDFHLRPAGWDNLSKVKKKPSYDGVLEEVNKQIAEGMTLENDYFKVYGIRHKFNPDFSRKINFSRCWAIPMLPTFGADGNVHLCFDMRAREDLIMCRHDPDPSEILKFWNTDKHREMVRGIKVKDCPRCTFGTYNEIIEKVIIDDSMCRYFP